MTNLSDPLQVGRCALKHRVVMAPMTRLRADDHHVPPQMMADYYSQRAAVPGTLLITEASFISAKSCGRDKNAPGIFTESQVAGWRRVTDAVHAKGSFIFMQLWHVGRAARAQELERVGLECVSSSDLPISEGHPTPRPMTEEEIWECVGSFARAAENAVAAGFDGVEIHAANGYLIDQFTQDVCNRRTDQWGGSIENRARLCLEIAKAVTKAIGSDRTAVRLSPFSPFQAMRMADPKPQFTYVVDRLKDLGLAYLHLVEPSISGNIETDTSEAENLDFALDAWDRRGPVILAGGYDKEKADGVLERHGDGNKVAIAFGRPFIPNPDLPFRLMNEIPLVEPDRKTFYNAQSPVGYTDFAFSKAWEDKQGDAS
ncbi:hypothetical protein N3K66_007159 [Trichothecium roseum]|uniref:Uncharacterized protein n=1 Tax=Trichothecium roseum TaxID=47278 RepID=A0ACC0UXK5_9HYPO|nr:hypothetical protein N3K66_007159 [Trichothecium roseum]